MHYFVIFLSLLTFFKYFPITGTITNSVDVENAQLVTKHSSLSALNIKKKRLNKKVCLIYCDLLEH